LHLSRRRVRGGLGSRLQAGFGVPNRAEVLGDVRSLHGVVGGGLPDVGGLPGRGALPRRPLGRMRGPRRRRLPCVERVQASPAVRRPRGRAVHGEPVPVQTSVLRSQLTFHITTPCGPDGTAWGSGRVLGERDRRRIRAAARPSPYGDLGRLVLLQHKRGEHAGATGGREPRVRRETRARARSRRGELGEEIGDGARPRRRAPRRRRGPRAAPGARECRRAVRVGVVWGAW